MSQKEPSIEDYQHIDDLCELGNESMNHCRFSEAIEHFQAAMNILPEPKENRETSGWIYTAIGDAYFLLNDYEKALHQLQKAFKICGIEEINPFILLRIGQCFFHQNLEKQAVDYLLRAYMIEGERIFDGEEQYFHFLRNKVDLTEQV